MAISDGLWYAIPYILSGGVYLRKTLQYSLVEGEESAEWASEGVQVGQVKSGVGILGMWTGAQHDRMDPLGMSCRFRKRSRLTPYVAFTRSLLDVEGRLRGSHYQTGYRNVVRYVIRVLMDKQCRLILLAT